MIQADRHTIIQILGGLMNKPSILNDVDKYNLETIDFPLQLDKYIFATIYNLYVGGAERIHAIDVLNELNNNAAAKVLVEKENGQIFLQDCEANAEADNFSFYYNKLKRINLVRDLKKDGYDVSDIYSENTFDDDYDKIMKEFEKLTPTDIINKIKLKFIKHEERYSTNIMVREGNPADGIRDLIKKLKEKPDIGCPLIGDIFNTVTRGGRKGKLYIRSAGSGIGKSRRMVGDACNLAYPIRYDTVSREWICTGNCEKVLYVMTEQEEEEIDTMILAYLTGYNEDMFKYGTYTEAEMPRIEIAMQIMEKYKDNFLYANIPDPCASVVKNLFRKYNLQYGVEHFFYDYIFSSPAMLNEYRDLKLNENVCLRLFTTTLKNLAVELKSFVMTATQLSVDEEADKKGGFKNYNRAQGSKSIVNTCDCFAIMSRPTVDELNQISKFRDAFGYMPNLIIDISKNRGGRHNNIRIWCYYDAGTCLTKDLFVTTANMEGYQFEIMDIKPIIDDEFIKEMMSYNSMPTGSSNFENMEIASDCEPDLIDAAAAFEDSNKYFKDKLKEKSVSDYFD